MSDCEEELELGRFLRRTVKKEKAYSRNNRSSCSNLIDTTKTKQIVESNIDSNHLYNFSKRIVRIEYPGIVQNLSKAIETLGGMHGIQLAVAEPRSKLELHFHPQNRYNKPCSADRDSNPGVLIKVKQHFQDVNGKSEVKYSYEVIGITSLNFKFNRICDFQYLPLASTNETETTYSDMTYMYEEILPEKLPNLEWFLSEECCHQSKFLIPTNFARFDSSQNKLYLSASEKFDSSIRPEISKLMENTKPQKKLKSISMKQASVFVNFQIPNVQIPEKPPTDLKELINERNLGQTYETVKKLFEERPVWTKVAIQHKTGLNNDNAKIILPAVGYFCHIGPWRMTWVRYQYNPQKDFQSRIYQTLDYRIRDTEGTKLKVYAKRCYTSKRFYGASSGVKKVSLKDKITSNNKKTIDERSYVLKPPYIPPARQMFYQYCDILLPEIQEMVARLPKLPASAKCDPKNGWLPINFTEQCREIVNKYVIDQVQEELLQDAIKKRQQLTDSEELENEEVKEKSSAYCSKMLSNIKKGIYKSVEIPSTSKGIEESLSHVYVVDLLEETDEELKQVNVDDVVNSLPETIDENSDEEHLSQCSYMDIDMEAVEEVNKMISDVQKE